MQVPVGQNGFVPPTPYDDEDRIEIRDLFSALLRQKTKIIAATFLGGLITYLIVSQITPRYEARSAVMIDPRTVQVLSEGQLVPGANINDALLYTEVSVLRSNLHLQKVIATIPDEMLANFDPASKPPGMMSRARSAISDGVERLLVQIGMAEAQPVDEPVFLLSPEERRMRRLVGALRSGLQVYREGDSYIITVIVETEFPALSALFADRILDVYIDEQIALRVDAVRGASQYIAERVAQSRSEVEAAEKAAETLRAEQISLTGVSVEAMERQRIELSTQLSLARAELATARSRFQQIEGLIEEEGIASAAELLSSPFVLSLRQQLYEDGRRDSDLATRFDPDHPDRQRLKASMDSTTAAIEREVQQIVAQLRNEADVAQVRLETIRSTLAGLEERSAEAISGSLRLRQLEREAEAVRGNFQSLLLRLNQARAVEDLQQGNARIVEYAQIPNSPSAPRTFLFTAFGGTLGFAAGLIFAFYAKVAGPGLTRSNQVERVTGLPFLTALPRARWRNAREQLASLRALPNQPYAEGLRRLRMALRSRAKDRSVCSILVTSSLPNEGKTDTCVGLACIEALSNRSCLLLDLDLRWTGLARELQYKPSKGDLADLLRGNCSIEETTCRVPDGGFDLISLHRAAPELVDSISAERFRELIAALALRYDAVIIDSPSILSVSDALQFSRYCDATLMTVRYGDTPRRALAEASRNLNENPLPIRGAVLTKVNPSQHKLDLGVSSHGY